MARARLIKPGFFTNEDLTELRPPERATTVPAAALAARLCYEGLWLLADRSGRLEDRPKRIKGLLFPYEDFDVELLLEALAQGGFIVRYVEDGEHYLCIPTFLKHQTPHHREPDSTIPAPTTRLREIRPVSQKPRAGLGLALDEPESGPTVIDPVPVPVPDPESETETESESETESLSGNGNGNKSSAAQSAARHTNQRPDDPEENVSVVTRIAHEAIALVGAQSPDLTEHVKCLCADRKIAYNSGVVRKAIESALVQRARA